MPKNAAARSSVPREQRFRKAADAGDLRAQVHVAREAAIELLNHGGLDNEDEFNRVDALAGAANHSADAWTVECRRLKAAYALGIAIGQLVHSDFFKSGGTR